MDPRVIEKVALEAMVSKALDMNLTGVAFAFVYTMHVDHFIAPVFTVVGMAVRLRDPGRDTPEYQDTGANFGAVASTKFWEMWDIHQDSGTSTSAPRKGILGYRGGLYCQEMGRDIFVGFSGGSEDQDVEIAKVGMLIAYDMIVSHRFTTVVDKYAERLLLRENCTN